MLIIYYLIVSIGGYLLCDINCCSFIASVSDPSGADVDYQLFDCWYGRPYRKRHSFIASLSDPPADDVLYQIFNS